MVHTDSVEALTIYSTCPQSKDGERKDYVERVAQVARWSEEFGCTGILVYTDNSLVDPWLVSNVVIQSTRRLSPLVAIQPIYMHPYAAAKMVTSLAYLHQRRVALNMLAGGFKNDLEALGDTTPHDVRYERTAEYTLIMRRLLEGDPVTFEGKYYEVKSLRMTPPLAGELFPEILMSGSSPAGLAAAQAVGATAVMYPRPIEQEMADGPVPLMRRGARIGIIARETGDEAWRIAHERFPEDRRGEIAHRLAMQVSDSVWHRQLSEIGGEPVSAQSPYWLRPFQTYKTFCPYFVGSYEQTAAEISRFIARRYLTFILDIPPSEEELMHIGIVFRRALELFKEIGSRPATCIAAKTRRAATGSTR